MVLDSLLSTTDASDGGDGRRRRSTAYVTDRLEAGAERVGDLPARVRDTARDRATDAARRAADELLERATDRDLDPEELRADSSLEFEGDGNGEFAANGGSDSDSDSNDRLDRALEGFLRRYGLDAGRLNEHTLESIRTRLAAAGADAEPAELLEGVLEERSASGERAGSEDGDDPLAEACSRLRARMDADPERPIDAVLTDFLERDAVVAAHDLEGLLTEELPSIVAELQSGLAAAERTAQRRSAEAGPAGSSARTGPRAAPNSRLESSGSTAPDSRFGSGSGSVIGTGPGTDGTARPTPGESLRSTVAMAAAATTLLAGDDGLDPAVGHVATSLLRATDGGDVPVERLLTELVPLLLQTDAGSPLSFDLGEALESLQSQSTGSLALVGLFVANLAAMSLGAWVSRKKAPPIPEEIRSPDGETVVTDEQVRTGKKAFQANGLMNQGSILGNGSYFGVDLTADALDLKAEYMREYCARQRGADSFEDLEDGERAAVERRVEDELDADAPEGAIAQYSAAEVYAHRRIREAYVDRYYGGSPERGIPQGYVDSPAQAARIADFACWTAWMAHTNRPGSDHSYTNDWPYVPGTGNRPTGQVVVWSTISVVLLVAGGGAGVWAYHAFDVAEPTTELVDVPGPDSVSVTPAQYAAARYVPVAGALFVAQAFVGALLAHYYVERTGFYGIGDALGIDVIDLLPFSVGRAWHVNLGILWITTLWLAGGLFLPGLFSERDPPWQAEGATALLGALVVITVGAFAGVWLGTRGAFGSPGSADGDDGDLWWLLGSEGLEYLEVGRIWKVGLLAGFVTWTGLALRGVRQLDEPPTGLGHFMTYAGGSIALLFGASMLYTPETNMAVTEFWRWWVVHMWVEGVFEFFVTAVTSAALVSMDLLEKPTAEKAILFEVFAIMAAGIVGVSHHYWWVGLPDVWVPIGTTFSTLEFVPLVFVLYRSLGEYRTLRSRGEAFPYTLPLLFIVGSSVWNFVGGGVLGFFINLPLINYYEHGTYLTVAHAHTATFGAFGLLALGLGTYILRVVTPEGEWEPSWFRGAFWLTNVGLTVMTVASLLPIGFLQLQTSYQDGYAAARGLEFYERDDVQTLLWARTLGDTPMILGALAFTVGSVRHLLAARRNRQQRGAAAG